MLQLYQKHRQKKTLIRTQQYQCYLGQLKLCCCSRTWSIKHMLTKKMANNVDDEDIYRWMDENDKNNSS